MSEITDPTDLLESITSYSKIFMDKFDGSHDFAHVMRVYNNALMLISHSDENLDILLIKVAALMHDMDDHKYSDQSNPNFIRDIVREFGGSKKFGIKVQETVKMVSWSYETKNGDTDDYKKDMTSEIKIVQDADRLEAIGGFGLGRTFMYNGAKAKRFNDVLDHCDNKLLHVYKRMKTAKGREIAIERTERIKTFITWIEDETL